MRRRRKIVTIALALTAFAVLLFVWQRPPETWLELRIRRDLQFLGVNAEGYREYLHRETGIVFVRLPGGTYVMGATAEEQRELLEPIPVDRRLGLRHWIAAELPRHRVTLSPFLIAKHEVTQAQWRRVMGTSPSGFEGDDLPVDNVSWEDCQAFCRKTGFRLPTEAEWEYACRAGTSTPFSFGETITSAQVNYNGEHSYGSTAKGLDRRTTVTVGSLPASGFGLHEIHANVWEWCQDLFDADFYAMEAARRRDPVSAEGSEFRVFRVFRGGSWRCHADVCRSAFRGREPQAFYGIRLGLRPAFPSSL